MNEPHHLEIRVYYEDTDFSGVVYHASYLRFLERGRTEYLRAAGIDQSALHAGGEGLFFAVRSLAIDYVRPARMDDLVRVQTHLAEVRGASLVMRQAIHRGGGSNSAEILATAQVRVAALSGGKPARLPPTLKDRLAQP